MLRFTKRADYGLMAIHYIAIHDDRGAVSAKRIAEEFAIPQRAAGQDPPAAGQAEADREPERPQGRLRADPAAERDHASGEVIRALEGPISIVSCLEDSDCPQMERCNLRRPVHEDPGGITQMLDTMSLAELDERATSRDAVDAIKA